MTEFIVKQEYPEKEEFMRASGYPELVRCKNCEYKENCVIRDKELKELDWFCADGTKKAEEK